MGAGTVKWALSVVAALADRSQQAAPDMHKFGKKKRVQEILSSQIELLNEIVQQNAGKNNHTQHSRRLEWHDLIRSFDRVGRFEELHVDECSNPNDSDAANNASDNAAHGGRVAASTVATVAAAAAAAASRVGARGRRRYAEKSAGVNTVVQSATRKRRSRRSDRNTARRATSRCRKRAPWDSCEGGRRVG